MIDFVVIVISIFYALILIFGYTVYQHNTDRPANQYFYWLSIAFVVWLVSNSMQLITTDQASVFFLYADYFVAPWGLLLLFLFVYHLPDYYKKIPRLITLILYGMAGFFSLVVTQQLIITDVFYSGSIPISSEGVLYMPYASFLLALVFGTVSYLVYYYFTLRGLRRKQIAYILSATVLVFVTLTIINLLFSETITNEYQFVLNNLSLVWILLVGWSIKHDLFTIKNFSTPLVQVVLITILSVSALWAYDSMFAVTENLPVSDMAWRILFAVVAVPLVFTLYSLLNKYINRVFAFDKSLVGIVNRDIGQIQDLTPTSAQEITNLIDDSLYQIAGVYPVWIFNGPNGWFLVSQRSDITEITPEMSTHIIRRLDSHKGISVASELSRESLPHGKKNKWAHTLQELGLEILYPLRCSENEEGTEEVYGAMMLYNETPFLGEQELSYIKMMIPQVNPILYKLIKE